MGILPDLNRCFPSHPSEEILEEYVLNRLPEARTAQVEEHLLICQSCRDTVAETDSFMSALKVAARQPAPVAGPVLTGWRNSAPIAALVVLALVAVWKYPQETGAPVAVTLSSLRGANLLSPAPAGKPLQLSIDVPDLLSGKEYCVEVVDAAGGPVWKGVVSGVDGKLVATMSKPLGYGAYWVRLYGTNSELLREFGLSAE
jgi:hypothetical protein